LTELKCRKNQLTALPDLSALVNLQTLNCSVNQLTALPESLSALVQLTELKCRKNQLTVLPDLSALQNLRYLDCAKNQLTDEEKKKLADLNITVNFEPQHPSSS
jgi:internalin A